MKFESKYKTFHSWKCTWRYCLWNGSHFFQGEIRHLQIYVVSKYIVRIIGFQQLAHIIFSYSPFCIWITENIFTFSIVSQHWDGISSWNSSSWKVRTDNTMSADELVISIFELIISPHHKNEFIISWKYLCLMWCLFYSEVCLFLPLVQTSWWCYCLLWEAQIAVNQDKKIAVLTQRQVTGSDCNISLNWIYASCHQHQINKAKKKRKIINTDENSDVLPCLCCTISNIVQGFILRCSFTSSRVLF